VTVGVGRSTRRTATRSTSATSVIVSCRASPERRAQAHALRTLSVEERRAGRRPAARPAAGRPGSRPAGAAPRLPARAAARCRPPGSAPSAPGHTTVPSPRLGHHRAGVVAQPAEVRGQHPHVPGPRLNRRTGPVTVPVPVAGVVRRRPAASGRAEDQAHDAVAPRSRTTSAATTRRRADQRRDGQQGPPPTAEPRSAGSSTGTKWPGERGSVTVTSGRGRSTADGSRPAASQSDREPGRRARRAGAVGAVQGRAGVHLAALAPVTSPTTTWGSPGRRRRTARAPSARAPAGRRAARPAAGQSSAAQTRTGSSPAGVHTPRPAVAERPGCTASRPALGAADEARRNGCGPGRKTVAAACSTPPPGGVAHRRGTASATRTSPSSSRAVPPAASTRRSTSSGGGRRSVTSTAGAPT
jgi:hypothetical protein